MFMTVPIGQRIAIPDFDEEDGKQKPSKEDPKPNSASQPASRTGSGVKTVLLMILTFIIVGVLIVAGSFVVQGYTTKDSYERYVSLFMIFYGCVYLFAAVLYSIEVLFKTCCRSSDLSKSLKCAMGTKIVVVTILIHFSHLASVVTICLIKGYYLGKMKDQNLGIGLLSASIGSGLLMFIELAIWWIRVLKPHEQSMSKRILLILVPLLLIPFLIFYIIYITLWCLFSICCCKSKPKSARELIMPDQTNQPKRSQN